MKFFGIDFSREIHFSLEYCTKTKWKGENNWVLDKIPFAYYVERNKVIGDVFEVV